MVRCSALILLTTLASCIVLWRAHHLTGGSGGAKSSPPSFGFERPSLVARDAPDAGVEHQGNSDDSSRGDDADHSNNNDDVEHDDDGGERYDDDDPFFDGYSNDEDGGEDGDLPVCPGDIAVRSIDWIVVSSVLAGARALWSATTLTFTHPPN